jgi:hypothetical protein
MVLWTVRTTYSLRSFTRRQWRIIRYGQRCNAKSLKGNKLLSFSIKKRKKLSSFPKKRVSSLCYNLFSSFAQRLGIPMICCHTSLLNRCMCVCVCVCVWLSVCKIDKPMCFAISSVFFLKEAPSLSYNSAEIANEKHMKDETESTYMVWPIPSYAGPLPRYLLETTRSWKTSFEILFSCWETRCHVELLLDVSK